MRLFGKSSAKKKTDLSPQDSILHMKSTAEMLERKEQHLLSKISSEESSARHAASVSNRPAALISLKRKKLYEQQLEHCRGARFNLETQIIAIENANMNLETLGAMRSGSAAMKSIHGSMDLDAVDATVDDIREQMDLAQEISVAISQPMGLDVGVDEDELLRELDLLEQEEVDKSLLMGAIPTTGTPQLAKATSASPSASSNSMPTIKKAQPVEDDDEEERELRKLQESMIG